MTRIIGFQHTLLEWLARLTVGVTLGNFLHVDTTGALLSDIYL